MAARFGRIATPSNSIWWTKPDTWPIIACMGLALGWTGYNCVRGLAINPDVSVSPKRRGAPVKGEWAAQETDAWTANRRAFLLEDVSKITIFGSNTFKH